VKIIADKCFNCSRRKGEDCDVLIELGAPGVEPLIVPAPGFYYYFGYCTCYEEIASRYIKRLNNS